MEYCTGSKQTNEQVQRFVVNKEWGLSEEEEEERMYKDMVEKERKKKNKKVEREKEVKLIERR